MKRKEILIWLGLVFIFGLLFLAGCSKKSTNSNSETTNYYDEIAIRNLIASDTTAFSTSNNENPPDTSNFKVIGIDTVRIWWRWITDVQRSVDIDIYPADATHPYPFAFVYITDTLYGTFHIIGKDSLGNKIHIAKPLKEVAKRNAYFEKRGNNNQIHRGWRLEKISNILFYSAPICTRVIESVNITTTLSGHNLTLYPDDILELVPRDSILAFQPGDSVTITVTTGDATDSVYLHIWHYFHFFRGAMQNNGDGTFTKSGYIPPDVVALPCWHHFAVDVIKHSVIDGDAPYDSRSWGIVFKLYNSKI